MKKLLLALCVGSMPMTITPNSFQRLFHYAKKLIEDSVKRSIPKDNSSGYMISNIDFQGRHEAAHGF